MVETGDDPVTTCAAVRRDGSSRDALLVIADGAAAHAPIHARPATTGEAFDDALARAEPG